MKKYYICLLLLFVIQRLFANEGDKILRGVFDDFITAILIILGIIAVLFVLFITRERDHSNKEK